MIRFFDQIVEVEQPARVFYKNCASFAFQKITLRLLSVQNLTAEVNIHVIA